MQAPVGFWDPLLGRGLGRGTFHGIARFPFQVVHDARPGTVLLDRRERLGVRTLWSMVFKYNDVASRVRDDSVFF